jgi:hypothetical protein
MRYTLEQLKGMDDKELGNHWYTGKFPFDVMKECGKCLASHRVLTCQVHGDIATPPFKVVSSCQDAVGAYLRPHLEEYLAARLFHDSLYPQPVAESRTEAAETLAVEK